ncbi:MAG: CCA tRNA nucleotidyltransferase [Holosporales bacterium]|nr:CCA tRNA nucleotidyltransferase [Holosporales bacterium]
MNYDFYFLYYPETKKLLGILERNNIEARFVGGCVRDAILGIKSDDLDIAVQCDIKHVVSILESGGVSCIPTGLKYGSITVLINEKKFELTTLRTDQECFGRGCTISESSSFEEDAKRRDFTVNALYVNMKGELFDYFNGIQDLEGKIVKFIGDPIERINEDYLRIFRYYRFCGALGDLSNRYCDVIKISAPNVSKVSIERIQKELFGILMSKHASSIMTFAVDSGIFNDIFTRINEWRKFGIDILDDLNNLEIKLYILFEYNDLMLKLHLTKIQKARIKEYRKYENESQMYCFYKKGLDFLREIQAILKFKYGIIDEKFELPSGKLPTFPVQFGDLPCGFKNASKRIQDCERWWINHDFTKNKKECLEYMLSSLIP